ncbi:MAG: hypothetical protein RL148_2141 [Planctomycetota bacterium]|jgi:hypothetical protein
MLLLAFLNPMLLWALPLCALPIVIHLLNRRRFQVKQWAAMEYLLNAMKRNRKRMRMEQWLVLLLRVLAVLFLVFLVARPAPQGGSLVGSVTHHVVVLDASASMQQRNGSTRLFDRAQERVRELAEKLADTRSGDLFSVVVTTRSEQPDLWAQRIGPDLGRRVGALLKEQRCSDGTTDLGTSLAAARTRAAAVAEASRTEYYVVGDQRVHDWLTDDEKPRPALAAQLAAMDEEAEHLTSSPVGGRETANLAVAAVRRLDRLAVAGVPVALAVDVVNRGSDPSEPTEVAVEVDGQGRVVRPVEVLAPGQRTTVVVSHTFHASGPHRVEALLAATDTFPLDDRRTLALDVRERSRVLLVDGEPGEGDDGGETFFVAAALDPGGEALSGIEAQVVGDDALRDTDLAPFDLVALCNVAAPAAADVEKLEQYATGGGGVVFFAGAQVDPVRYSERLHRDGKGLLPAAYGEQAGDPDRPEPLFLARPDHPIAARFPELLERLLAGAVRMKRWLPIVEKPSDGVAALMRVRDGEGPVVAATKPFGSGGEVVQFGFTADKQWSNWPETYANVIVLQEVHRFAARLQDTTRTNLEANGSLVLALDPARHQPDAVVRSLGGDGDERTFTAVAGALPAGAPADAVAPLTLTVPMADLATLGGFQLELRTHGDGNEVSVFSRNVPLDEGRLARMAAGAFQKAYPPELQARVTLADENAPFGPAGGAGEAWRLLAALLLVGLLLESLFAWRFRRG